MKKQNAPKGKGKQNQKVYSKKSPAPVYKKPVITIEAAIRYLQQQGIQITEDHIENLKQIAKITPAYTGIKKNGERDNAVHQKRIMLQALEQTLGIVKRACDISGIPRRTHYDWMEDDEEYNACVKDIGEIALDFAEGTLLDMVKEKNTAVVIFYMKTKGKKRGYIETVHNMNMNFDDNNVHFYMPDNTRDGMFEDAKVIGP